MNQAKLPILKDSEIQLTIASLSHGGSGVGRFDNFVVFVPFTAPGDTVQVKITSLKKNYAEAELLKIITPSDKRIDPLCPVFGTCGGCQWQHVNYEEQLRQKQGIVQHALSRIAKEEGGFEILPIIPSPKPFYYRNRAQFRSEGPRVGFYRRGSHELIEFEKCYIVEESINEELRAIKNELKDASEFKTSKTEVAISESSKLFRSVNKAHSEELGFSQVNTLQNKNMQDYICQLLGSPIEVDTDNIGSRGNLLDLYCGQGNFSFPLNQKGWRIYGVDASKQAITKARTEANDHTFFSANDCSKEAYKLANADRKFEAIFLDPPRIGADERLFSSTARLSPEKLIYVSCNPATFARDWARLKNKTGMKLKSVQPFDMFPQTFHVELVAFMTK